MTKSYTQILQQIEHLKAEAEAVRRKEVEGVVARIKEAIAVYGLTAEDLGLAVSSAAGARGARNANLKKARQGGRPASGATSAATVRYRDEAGNTWGGRGPRPRWLRNALASGKTLKDLEV